MATYDFFAARRTTFLAGILRKVLVRRFLSEIRDHCDCVNDVLEIGTGDGYLARALRDAGYRYLGYEPNDVLAEQARAAGFEMRNALVPPLQEYDSSCDVILMSHVFEHMADNRQAMEFLAEAKRCLRPGGTLIILSPDLIDFGADFWNVDYTHTFPTSLHRVQQMLMDSGLSPDHPAFVYGSFGYFPGYFLNLLNKFVLGLFHPVLEPIYPRWPKLYKLRTTFSRSFMVLARKPV
jgi:SAM-dependent methyltransferase